MTKRVNPAFIGAFVVGAFAVLIAAIMVVGSGQLFKKPLYFVCMFQGDLNGLKAGAPVKFRGVQIGSVKAIKLVLSPDEGRLKQDVKGLWLPVIVEIDSTQIVASGGTGAATGQVGFDELTNRGMRAQLAVESILTGLLYIDLDLHPNAALNLVLETGGRYREIPTTPTAMEAIQKQVTEALAKLNEIDFQALVVSITDAANSVKRLADSPKLQATLDSLKEDTANLNTTLVAMHRAIDKVNTHVDPLFASFQKNSAEVNATLAQTRATLGELQSTLDPDQPLLVHMNEALDQLTETTRSIGAFADYLQRNPSALIRGKYVSDKDRQN